MVHAPCPKLCANLVRRSETKVCDGYPKAIVKAKHVLGLQITVVDAKRMTIFHGVEQLKKNMLYEMVAPQIATVVANLGKEVMVGSVVHNDVGVFVVLDNTMQRDDVRMSAGDLVKGDFSDMELSLAG